MGCQGGTLRWIDFIDDAEVARKLLEQVEAFGRAHGMEKIQGPLGFTDFDPEGTLIEGFDELDTMGTLYNYDYYPASLSNWDLKRPLTG